MNAMTLGQRIAECRKKLGLSQEGLGDKLGVSRQAISKWEADGAVPEVDKLIGMSRLFGVSVGWLLGIEEETVPEQKTEISEELLRKIEEIVLRYRPRKQPLSAKKKALLVLAAVLALCVGGSWLNRWGTESSMLAFTQAQVENINEQNANIQAQLNQLASRLDSMAEAEEEQTKILADYSFTVEPVADEPMAEISFSAVPKSWAEGDSAYLSVLLPDGSGVRPDCVWDGAFLTASGFLLPAENGCAVCITIVHADGTREQQTLRDYMLENLKDELTLVCEVKPGTAEFQIKGGDLKMTVTDCEVHVRRPGIAGEDIYFTSIDYILYQCTASGHQEIDSYNLYKHIVLTEENTGYGPDVWCYGEPIFQVPDLRDGDGLELWVRAELSNGMSTVEMVGSWANNNGEFIGSVPVE